jgi:hypothetical protein
MQCLSVTLPHGFSHDGVWMRTVVLRGLTGRDQGFLQDEAASLPPAQWATALLARLVMSAAGEPPLGPDTIGKLAEGDREALLLHLCRGLLGERLSCVLRCPHCRESINLDLHVPELLVPPVSCPAEEYSLAVAGYDLVLRPVAGRDLEAASDAAAAAAASLLLRRCVKEASPPLPEPPIPPELAAALSEELARLDPQADLLLDVQCPACGVGFSMPFDAGDVLRQELSRRGRDHEEEVHALAFYYHWNEESILALPLHRRRRYVEMIGETLSGGEQ